MKDAKLQTEITRKNNFNRIAPVPVIHIHPKHGIPFVVIPNRSCRFHWRQHPRFWSDPASRHDWKSPSSKFRMWISALLLMHNCCCFLFRCPCVFSLSLSLQDFLFLFTFYSQFKENIYLWLIKRECLFVVGKLESRLMRDG